MMLESAKRMSAVWRGRIAPAVVWHYDRADAHWRWLTFAMWVGICVFYLVVRWQAIHWFALGDTDDNIRYVQVKDWMAGQGWFDLRQYRLDPPGGANIHWSRIVDLPIAGLILFFRLFTDSGHADRLACAIAPLLPLFPLMLSLAFIVRRLTAGPAWILAALAPLAAQMGLSMFMPLRIDHHGWQLALTVAMLAGVVDRDRLRGGVIAGVASAVSIAIGMEMIIYLAVAGALIALQWVFDPQAAKRMRPYALSLGGSIALLFPLFASYANRLPMCDALSPVWVAILGMAAGGMVLLTLLPLRSWWARLLVGAAVGAGVGLFAWLNWPQCLSGAYQLSPELQKLWLANIREAKPITAQARNIAVPLLAIPVIGILSAFAGCWSARRDTDRLWAWVAVTLMTLAAFGLLFWQLRAGPAAQLLAIPAAAWAAGAALRAIFGGRRFVRIGGLLVAVLVVAVLFAYPLYPQINGLIGQAMGGPGGALVKPAVKARREAIRKANGRCRALPALEVLNQLPPATIFTMVDLGPRLIATTHHSAIAGPYHRNAWAILDIHHAFDGQPEDFRPIAVRHHARYLLFCPDFPEGTVYSSRSPAGFYAQLMRKRVPDWLVPVAINTRVILPYTLYRIDYALPNSAPVGKKATQ
jgi:hypothetical protein